MATVDSQDSGGSTQGSLSTVARIRFAAFSLVVVGPLAFNFGGTPTEVLTAAFVGWFEDIGIHQVHDMTISAMIWLALVVPLALLLYHPSRRVNTVLAPVVMVVLHAVLAYLSDAVLLVPFLIMSVLALLVLVLHPAGGSLARFDRFDPIDRRLVAVYAVGAVGLLVYAGIELAKQLGSVDEHVVFVHFGGMAIGAILVVLMGALAVFRRRDWRFAAWSAGLIAAFVGLVSVVYPAGESSLGTIAGGLLAIWAVTFVAGVEHVRQGEDKEAGSTDDTVAGAA